MRRSRRAPAARSSVRPSSERCRVHASDVAPDELRASPSPRSEPVPRLYPRQAPAARRLPVSMRLGTRHRAGRPPPARRLSPVSRRAAPTSLRRSLCLETAARLPPVRRLAVPLIVRCGSNPPVERAAEGAGLSRRQMLGHALVRRASAQRQCVRAKVQASMARQRPASTNSRPAHFSCRRFLSFVRC